MDTLAIFLLTMMVIWLIIITTWAISAWRKYLHKGKAITK